MHHTLRLMATTTRYAEHLLKEADRLLAIFPVKPDDMPALNEVKLLLSRGRAPLDDLSFALDELAETAQDAAERGDT